jgi:hypothetical protein
MSSFVASLSALAVAVPVAPAAEADHPDAALIALGLEFERACAAKDAAAHESEIADAIYSAPALTLAGLAVKAAVVLRDLEDEIADEEPELIGALCAKTLANAILQIAGVEAPTIVA